MELTYGEVMGSNEALGEVLKLSPAPTVAIGAKLARNARKLQEAMQDYQAALEPHRAEIVAKYTTTWTDEEGKEQKGIAEADEPAANAEFAPVVNELLSQKVEVDVRPITYADLERCEEKRPGFELPSNILYTLAFMFDLEESKPEPKG